MQYEWKIKNKKSIKLIEWKIKKHESTTLEEWKIKSPESTKGLEWKIRRIESINGTEWIKETKSIIGKEWTHKKNAGLINGYIKYGL